MLQIIYYLLNLWVKVKFGALCSGAERTLSSPLCVLRALGRSGQEPSPHVLRSVQARTPKWVENKQFINEHEATSERTASLPLVDMLSTFLKHSSNFRTSLCISGVGKLWAAGQIWEVVCLIKLYRNITMCTVCILFMAVFIIQGLPSSALHILDLLPLRVFAEEIPLSSCSCCPPPHFWNTVICKAHSLTTYNLFTFTEHPI